MTHHVERVVLPFAALVGQEKLKKALVLNAINPRLCGALVRGEKGTAKSTAVRSLAELLPEIEVVKCSFHCSPNDPSLQCDTCNNKYEQGEKLPTEKRKMRVIDLPLGATEDRVVGTLDIEKALREGIRALQPGILAEVNQGILYIDEVNLLDDHLVDVLLDSAAMGVNTIEREGVSLSHPSRFILVGTMNPEEGDLRPQLLDRFGLAVDVFGIKDVQERVAVIKVVEEFERDPIGFCRRFENEQKELRERILKARDLLRDVVISDELLLNIAEICTNLAVDGHRADFLIARTAKTIAAFHQRTEVMADDVKEAAELVLPHRMKRKPFEQPKPFQEEIEKVMQQEKNRGQDDRPSASESEPSDSDSSPNQDKSEGSKEEVFGIGEQRRPNIEVNKDGDIRVGFGRRAQTTSVNMGKYIKSRIPQQPTSDIAIDATMRASVARTGTLQIGKEDIREKVREKKTSSVIVFVVDASGSMGAMKRMEAAKGAVMALLEDAYQKRDKVAFVAFRRDRAEVLLPPTSSVELAASYLRELPTGGKTPLPDGMYKGMEILRRERMRNEKVIPIMVLVSDGRGNVPIQSNVKEEVLSLAGQMRDERINLVVVDSGNGLIDVGYGKVMAEASGGSYHCLDSLDSQGMVGVIRPLMDVR